MCRFLSMPVSSCLILLSISRGKVWSWKMTLSWGLDNCTAANGVRFRAARSLRAVCRGLLGMTCRGAEWQCDCERPRACGHQGSLCVVGRQHVSLSPSRQSGKYSHFAVPCFRFTLIGHACYDLEVTDATMPLQVPQKRGYRPHTQVWFPTHIDKPLPT